VAGPARRTNQALRSYNRHEGEKGFVGRGGGGILGVLFEKRGKVLSEICRQGGALVTSRRSSIEGEERFVMGDWGGLQPLLDGR